LSSPQSYGAPEGQQPLPPIAETYPAGQDEPEELDAPENELGEVKIVPNNTAMTTTKNAPAQHMAIHSRVDLFFVVLSIVGPCDCGAGV